MFITGGQGNIASIVKNNLDKTLYNIYAPSRLELNILNIDELNKFFLHNKIDIIIHTAIKGGRRSAIDDENIVESNLIMFNNITKFAHMVKMIINLDSGAIYDRNSDILNRKESDIKNLPEDYYGKSKYLIYKKSLSYSNVINFRIFNLFSPNEENNRFIKSCFINSTITIYENKYFDFFYYLDFLKVLNYYLINISILDALPKVVNLSYTKKYTLYDIALLVKKFNKTLQILEIEPISNKNYSGCSEILDSLQLHLNGLEYSLDNYNNILNT